MTIRDRVIEEIKLLPEHMLAEVYDFVHYFRLGLQKTRADADQIMKYAGCWQDMPEEIFEEFVQEIARRRRVAFSGR